MREGIGWWNEGRAKRCRCGIADAEGLRIADDFMASMISRSGLMIVGTRIDAEPDATETLDVG